MVGGRQPWPCTGTSVGHMKPSKARQSIKGAESCQAPFTHEAVTAKGISHGASMLPYGQTDIPLQGLPLMGTEGVQLDGPGGPISIPPKGIEMLPDAPDMPAIVALPALLAPPVLP